MRDAAITLLCLLAAGCSTPGDVRRDGVRHDYTLRSAPADAIRCITRNADDYGMGLIVQERTDGVIVRSPETAIAVADVRPTGGGSAVTIWRHSVALGNRGLPDAMVRGC